LRLVSGMETRDLLHDKKLELFKEIEKRAAAIATASGTTITFKNRPPDAANRLLRKKCGE
jgi:hypothetical protein